MTFICAIVFIHLEGGGCTRHEMKEKTIAIRNVYWIKENERSADKWCTLSISVGSIINMWSIFLLGKRRIQRRHMFCETNLCIILFYGN